ncbi:MAG TPA: DUF4309 domain-containing protein [Bacillales bacterium]|nr:DUF4309 domain-containing protein [Bacillales bacterium]
MYTNYKFITFTLTLALLLLTACQDPNNASKDASSNEQNTNTETATNSNILQIGSNLDEPEVTEPQLDSNDIGKEQKSNEEYSLIDETFLPNLAKGRIKYCELPLDPNITASQILSKFGEPEWEDYWDGGYGRLYGDCIYFVDSENSNAKMTAIDYGSEKLTHTPSEIIEILGEPESKGLSDIDGSYFLFYQSGHYSVYFEFEDENSPVGLLRTK